MAAEDTPISPDQTVKPEPETIDVGNGVVLREITVADSEEMFALIDSSREHLSQYGEDTASKYPTLQSVIDRNSTQASTEKRFGIRDQEKMVGFIKVTDKGLPGWEMGYWMGADFAGKGYMTKATRALTDFTYSKIRAQRIFATVHRDNFPSRTVLERTGFVYDGVNPQKTKTDVIYAHQKPHMLSES